MSHYYVDNNFYKIKNIDSDLDWLIINHLYKPIDNNKDWVIAISILIY